MRNRNTGAAMLTIDQVVDYILWSSADRPSPMKLQKLLYYAQGHCLALRGEPMFDAEFQAWKFGPVVPGIYRRFKDYWYSPINIPVSIEINAYSPEDLEILSGVVTTYGQLPAEELSDCTHEEPPWFDSYRRGERDVPITRESIADWFNVLVDQDSYFLRRDFFHHQNRRRIAERVGRHRDKLAALADRNKDLDPWADED